MGCGVIVVAGWVCICRRRISHEKGAAGVVAKICLACSERLAGDSDFRASRPSQLKRGQEEVPGLERKEWLIKVEEML